MSDGPATVFCQGGPLHDRWVTIRDTGTFLAADKAASKAWIYQRQDDDVYVIVTDHDDSLIYPDGPITGERSIDWYRLPLTTDTLQVVSLGGTHEAYAGDPADDGWGD